MRIVIEIRDGMVQTVYGNTDCEVEVYDFDMPCCLTEYEYEYFDSMSDKYQHEIDHMVRLW